MIDAILALLPIIMVIGLGRALRFWPALGDSFWAGADKITYYVFFPVLLFSSISQADLADLPIVEALAITIPLTTLVAGLAWIAGGRGGLKPGARAALVQGSIRPNTYVALALAFSLFGESGYTMVAFGVIAFVPWVNLLSVIAHVHGAKTRTAAMREIVRQVLVNPLLIACLLGGIVNLTDLALPDTAQQTLSIIGSAALPMGLLTVGAALDMKIARAGGGVLATGAILKLLVLPGIAIVVLNVAGMEEAGGAAILLFAAMPASVSSFALSRNMGGDHKLMAAIITGETILAAATLPVWLYLRELLV